MNVLIVDDDRFVVASLVQGMNWNELGFDQIFTAYHIGAAKKIIETKQVDLLLSDIDMPHGSGLDLLSWIRERQDDMVVIILTNYADFNYAQKALSLKTFHYFLKPIEYDKLSAIIQKAILQVRKRDVQESHICRHFWQSYLQHTISSDPDNLDRYFSLMQLPYRASDFFLPVFFLISPWYLTPENELKSHFSTDSQLLQYMETSFQSVFSPLLSSGDIFLQYKGSASYYLAIFQVDGANVSPELFMHCEQLVHTLRSQMHLHATCLGGEPVKLSDFPAAFSVLYRAVKNCLDFQEALHLSAHMPSPSDVFPSPDTGLLTICLNNQQYEGFLDYCLRYLQELSSQGKLHSNSMNSFQIDVVQVLYVFLQEQGILAHKLFHSQTYHQLADHAKNSIYDMKLYLTYILRTAKKHLNFSASESSVANSILEYVELHYAEDISRSSLAEFLYLDPDYASRLFKKETGISFGNYIIQKRIDVAKHLLLSTTLPINTIADDVGYGNYSYFIRLFKKITQMTPIEFRNHAGMTSPQETPPNAT